MAQYISIDNLQSKIEELKDYADEHWDNEEVKGVNKFLDKLEPIINTLEMKEVDLQKEIDRVWDNTSDKFSEDGWKEFEDIAKHFFELGMKVTQ